eukprot:scaffold9880_cov100-Skeletonema_dohrnii-CCMP3373.AAC.3
MQETAISTDVVTRMRSKASNVRTSDSRFRPENQKSFELTRKEAMARDREEVVRSLVHFQGLPLKSTKDMDSRPKKRKKLFRKEKNGALFLSPRGFFP